PRRAPPTRAPGCSATLPEPPHLHDAHETGRACRIVSGARTADTLTTPGSSCTITVPPLLRTDSTTPPGMFRAGANVLGSPTTVSVYGAGSVVPSTTTASPSSTKYVEATTRT